MLEQKADMMTHNATPNPAVIVLTYMKLAQLKPAQLKP
jgi:hypothetical protein